MSELDALLAGIIANPHDGLRWLVLADWLDDYGQPERAELTRLHRELLRTCVEPEAYPERVALHARVVELIDQGVKPCVPSKTLMLPGDVPMVANFIPPGSFLMGGKELAAEQPVHRVTLTKGFFLGVTPVNQAQWASVMGENPSKFQGEFLPVERVSWDEAKIFCRRVSIHCGVMAELPTEAVWEYACRSGTNTQYHWGDFPEAKRMNYDTRNSWNGSVKMRSRKQTSVPGMFASNCWGLLDMHGNVSEWCSDAYDTSFYARSPAEDPYCEVTAQAYRVMRGGNWASGPEYCRAAYRLMLRPGSAGPFFGLRLVFRAD